ncbi:MAG: 16S rRNA (cytosine(1402)-N(4))-methyltransferase RsmH [Clostridia bacterium]|nr:16S rRNA (cytosine(1402)-N(4))-methyltransferase RsmH [Clostridia bacterium]MBQ4323050.1 16S rRNA (cytosine(1402)-N(4))-methyltransferase RsmH [Clostridia bacterium]
MEFVHKSIMVDEILQSLNIRPDGVYADGTAGGGGHSRAIGERLSPQGTLICNDRDPEALAVCEERLCSLNCHLRLIRGTFSDLAENAGQTFDGVLLDLGVSSYQLDCAERGFSYMQDAPLDMRMNPEDKLSARQIVNEWSEAELTRIFFEYGEERYSRRIASQIVQSRGKAPIETTLQLVDIIKSALPKAALKEKQHPAKRVFQAIRIAVNDELEQVRLALDSLVENMNDGGRIAVLTFHSLEDRIVKTAFARYERPCTCPPEFPVCTCGKKSLGKVLVKGIAPSAEEIEENPRARSTRLRVFERRFEE